MRVFSFPTHAFVLALVATFGCGNKDAATPVTSGAMGNAEQQAIRAAQSPTPERSLGTIVSGSIGPFVAWRSADRGLAAYVSSPMGQSRNLIAWAVGDNQHADQKIALEVPLETSRLRLRELGTQGTSYVALYTHLENKGEALSLVTLGNDGHALSKPFPVASSSNLVSWFDATPTLRGALVSWIEETPAGADMLTLAVERDGTVKGVPTRIARNVTAWQLARDPAGATLALVQKTDKGDRIDVLRLDDGGQLREAVPVAEKQATQGDIDVVKTARGYRVAWTDRATGELRVLGAEVDTQSRKVTTSVLAEARGGATLVSLADAKHGTVLVWDERGRRDNQVRTIHVATVGRAGGRTDVAFDTDNAEPEVRGTDAGWMILTRQNGAPVLTKASPDLALRANVSTDTSWGPASMAWSMSCFDARCKYLTAIGDTDPKVAVVDVSPALPATAAADTHAPEGRELDGSTSFDVGEPIATLAAADVGDRTLVAVLTQSVEDPRKPQSASKLFVYAIDEKGALIGTPTLITDRALSVGGVAIAASEKPGDGAVLAFVQREKGDPEVMMASVDATGKRTKRAQLTQTKGDASDVALTRVSGGFMLAWVDGRLGRPEVFAAKVTRGLERVSREERITNAAGAKSDVALVSIKDDVFLAWSDTRDAEAEAFGDMYATKLNAKSGMRVGNETRVLATAPHSRSPSLFALGSDHVGLAWVEDGTTAESSAAMLATYTLSLERDLAPARLPYAGALAPNMAGGRPQSLALVADEKGTIAGMVARATANGATLEAVEGAPNALRAVALSTEHGRPTADTTVAATPRAVFFSEQGASAAEHRLHYGRRPVAAAVTAAH